MNSSKPNTSRVEFPAPRSNKLAGMTMDERADWYAQQAVATFNRLGAKARAKQQKDQKAPSAA